MLALPQALLRQPSTTSAVRSCVVHQALLSRSCSSDAASPLAAAAEAPPPPAAPPATPLLSLADITTAAFRIRGGVVETPFAESIKLSELFGCRMWTKNEFKQRTGSFKERGALNTILQVRH